MGVMSPGALQNSMTFEKMKWGQRSPRNPIVTELWLCGFTWDGCKNKNNSRNEKI
jgi:hypothetical protein